MSCGAAGHLAGFLIRTFKDHVSQRDPLPVDLPTSPTTLEHQCAWLDSLAFQVSDILDVPASLPLSTPTSNPLQCSWAEQLSFVNWNGSPPVVETLSSQPQSKWLDHLASFDYCHNPEPSFTGTEGYVAPFNIFVLVVAVVALMALFKLSRWVWRCREELAPYLLITTLVATREAASVLAPVHVMYHFGVFSTPYLCWTASWGLQHLLLLRDPISHHDYQILLDQVDLLTKLLDTTNATKESAEKKHHQATTTSGTKITDLENRLSKEQSNVAKLTVESEKTSSDMETLTAKNRSLMATTSELTTNIAGLHEEQESTARSHHEATKQRTLEISELNATLASTTKRAEDLSNDTEAKATQIEALNTRIADMQRDFDTFSEAHATTVAQLSSTADELALERQSLTTQNITVRAENTDLKQQSATLIQEKAVCVEDVNARTSEIAELRAALSIEKDQNDLRFEQVEAGAIEIAHLRDTLSSLREKLAEANARALNLDEREEPPHPAQAQSSEATEPEHAMVAETEDGVDDASRMGSPLEFRMSTDVFASPSGPHTEAIAMINQLVTAIDAEVAITPLFGNLLSGTELTISNLNEAGSIIDQEKDAKNTLFGQENALPALLPTALPISPPVTPPGNSTDLFASPRTTITTLGPEATPINCATLTASMDSTLFADVLATSPLPDPASIVEFPTAGLSHAGPTLRANSRGPRSLLDGALKATNTRGDAPALPRTAPTVTPGANIKPHSWDAPAASRVYHPGSDNNPAGGHSSTQRKHHGPKLGKHFHREKGPRPSRSAADQ